MFTKTFPRERHIEELRAELPGTPDPQEWREIQAEGRLLPKPDSLAGEERSTTCA